MSIIRNLAKKKLEERKAKGETVYNSSENYMFFGNGGKTATAASLSLYTERPVLIISPSGSAKEMESQFDNIITYQVDDLEELQSILDDINKEFQDAKRLINIIAANETDRLAKAKEVYEAKGMNWDEVFNDAKLGLMPISAVVLEEASVVSQWIKERCTDDLGLSGQIGEDKSKMG